MLFTEKLGLIMVVSAVITMFSAVFCFGFNEPRLWYIPAAAGTVFVASFVTFLIVA